MAAIDHLESSVQHIGEELARLSAGQSPSLFERQWWSQAAINLAMHDLDFKTQLFRFIDVLPSVADDQRVVTLAQEYFGAMTDQAFGLRWGLKALSATAIGARLSGQAIRAQVEQMARTFIAGSSIEDAAPVLGGLWTEGKAWSVDLLGEATISDREADRYRDRCVAALDALAQAAGSWPATPLLEEDHLDAVPRVQLSLEDLRTLSPSRSDRSGGQLSTRSRPGSGRLLRRPCGRRPR